MWKSDRGARAGLHPMVALLAAIALTGCPGVPVDAGVPDGGPSDAGTDGGAPPIDGGVDDDCALFCAVEDECGFRSYDTCVAEACPGGLWTLSFADSCVEAAADCAEVALCSCQARCDNEEVCIGSADPSCVDDCQTLAEQLPSDAYLESRCVIESPCEDIALCGA